MCAKDRKSRQLRSFILPPTPPFLRSFVPCSLVLVLFVFALDADSSSSVLEGTELLTLDRDETVVFKDAKTPESRLLQAKKTYNYTLITSYCPVWAVQIL